jgi:hypothetical protein
MKAALEMWETFGPYKEARRLLFLTDLTWLEHDAHVKISLRGSNYITAVQG